MELKILLNKVMNVMAKEKEYSSIVKNGDETLKGIEIGATDLGWPYAIVWGIILTGIVSILMLFDEFIWQVAFIVFIVTTLLAKPISHSRAMKKKLTFEEDYNAAKEKIRDAQEKLDALYQSGDYSIVQKEFPKKYMTPEIIMIFCEYAEDKRADTLKEAINLYEAEKRDNERMELQRKQLEAAMKSANLAEKSYKVAKKTHSTASWAAWGIWMKK